MNLEKDQYEICEIVNINKQKVNTKREYGLKLIKSGNIIINDKKILIILLSKIYLLNRNN